MTYKVVVSDSLSAAGIDLLNAVSEFEVVTGPMSREQALAAVADADALIVRSATKVNDELLAAAPRLKAVARAGAGVDNVDLESASLRGVRVMNTPGGNTIAAAEHTMALMLSLARHIPEAHQSLLEGRWDRKLYMGTELRGKTLGIIGLGRIGQAVAQRASAFEMKILAYDPNKIIEYFDCCDVESTSFDELLAASDYIVLHAPANDETRNFINADTISRMKDGVRLINTARGSLIDAQALADAITSGKVAAAALDVYASEPPEAGYPLIGLDRVIHTPHLGASTVEAQVTVAVQAAEQIRDALLNGDYRNVVNAAQLEQESMRD